MGNISCNNNICSDDLYELSWINTINWNIEYKYNNIENPYILDKGNFKLINNGYCFLLLNREIDINYDIKKILINFDFNSKILKNNFIEIEFIISNEKIDFNNIKNQKLIINNLKFFKNHILFNNKHNFNFNQLKYNLLINFSYLNYLVINESIFNNNESLYSNNNKIINYDFELNSIFFNIIIKSTLNNNNNMDNFLNIKIL